MGLSGGLASNGTQGGQGSTAAGTSLPRVSALQVFRGAMPVGSRSAIFDPHTSNGTDTGMNSRTAWNLAAATSHVRFVYVNSNDPASNTVSAISILLKAGVEYPGGTFRAVTFNGLKQITLDPGAMIVSDPIPVGALAAGTIIFARTSVSTAGGSTASGAWANNIFTASAQGEGVINTTTGVAPTDLTISGTITASASFGFGPTTVAGAVQASSPVPSVAGIGDSIMRSTNTDNGVAADYFIVGFLARALNQAYGFVQLGKNGDTFASATAPLASDLRLVIAAAYSNVCINYAVNDLMIASGTLATMLTNAMAMWSALSGLGTRVFQTTCTPRTSSSDAWATTANQTPVTTNVNAGEPARQTWNNWLRAGAPITSAAAGPRQGTATYASGNPAVTLGAAGSWVNGNTICGYGIPAATTILSGAGTTSITLSANPTQTVTAAPVLGGTIMSGSSTHPLYAVWDYAALIESTPGGVAGAGGSVWKAALTTDGIHPASNAVHATLAGAVNTAQLV